MTPETFYHNPRHDLQVGVGYFDLIFDIQARRMFMEAIQNMQRDAETALRKTTISLYERELQNERS